MKHAALILVLLAAKSALSAPTIGLTVPADCETVHDGDTATFAITIHCQVRYLSCWAPELSQPGGAESATSAKLAEGKHGRLFIPIGDPFELWKSFTFGRVLGEFWPDGASESESQRQVRLGYAATTKHGEVGK